MGVDIRAVCLAAQTARWEALCAEVAALERIAAWYDGALKVRQLDTARAGYRPYRRRVRKPARPIVETWG